MSISDIEKEILRNFTMMYDNADEWAEDPEDAPVVRGTINACEFVVRRVFQKYFDSMLNNLNSN